MVTQNQIGLNPSYGQIYMNTGNWTGVTFAFTTSYQELTSLGTNFTLASPSQDFGMTTDGRLKYTGAEARPFYVDALMQNPVSANYAIQLYLNGSPVTGSECYDGGSGAVILSRFPISLSQNDYLSIYAKRSANASTVITQISLSATFAGGM